ncbi:MAG TPA: SMC-Scp complex subunit ScpB [Nevskia sp.]|nr:SMC-Scp complex subunit ScpB [Nevskia sp.]
MSDTPEQPAGEEAAENKKTTAGETQPAPASERTEQAEEAQHEAAGEEPAAEAVPAEAAATEHEAAAEAPAAESVDVESAESVPAENYGRRLELILEALLLAADGPLPLDQMQKLVASEFNLARRDLRAALERMAARYAETACELREVASGWRLQVKAEYGEWVGRLWQEKPPKYSRALLETLALVVYRQPITRGEIEDVRGVAVSTNILRTLLERGWVREVGHKEVPGRPALYGTAAQFLDDFNLKSLDQLPSLPDIKDLEQLEAAMARLGQHADVVASVRAEQEAAENPIQLETAAAEGGETPPPGDDSIDEPPHDPHTLH